MNSTVRLLVDDVDAETGQSFTEPPRHVAGQVTNAWCLLVDGIREHHHLVAVVQESVVWLPRLCFGKIRSEQCAWAVAERQCV